MRREKLQRLVTTGMIERKHSRGKQHKNMLDGLTKWLKGGRVTATRDRDAWKVMIAYTDEQGT